MRVALSTLPRSGDRHLCFAIAPGGLFKEDLNMGRLPLGLVLVVVLVRLEGSVSLAAEPLPSVDSVLAKWEAVSQKCRILDAKLAVFRYGVFGNPDNLTDFSWGRFYYEAPNIARCEYRSHTTPPGRLEILIWNGKETLQFDERNLAYDRFSLAWFKKLRDDGSQGKGAFGWFSRFYFPLESPQQCLPLLIDSHAVNVRERFDVTIERGGAEILLKAIPKREIDKACYREIGVIVDAKTYLTSAIQIIDPNGEGRRVFQLMNQKVNQRPNDRDQLIEPDLSKFKVIDFDEIENGQKASPSRKIEKQSPRPPGEKKTSCFFNDNRQFGRGCCAMLQK
jgi:outer membrane lipoprotein-sorting protein